ncbi:polysaccharide biosynthesis tyrosine autokinase [Candidatus Poribacteria bacterium]|nr:polysaccharide biosynthesis tyrosine autokinase [Candidatus Poribacteria bacterium]
MKSPSPSGQMPEYTGEKEIRLSEYWNELLRRKWLIIIPFGIVVSATLIFLLVTPRQYTSKAVIKIPTQSGGGLAAALGAFLPIGQAGDVTTEVEIIKSRTISEKVIKELGLDKKPKNTDMDMRMIINKFQENLEVRQRGRTNLIDISAAGDTPKEAKEITDQVAIEYIDFANKSQQKAWNELITQMENKLKEVKGELVDSRNRLYQNETGEGIPTAFSPLLIGAGNQIGGDSSKFMIPEVPQTIAKLRSAVMELEIELDVLKKSYPPSDPKVVNLKAQLKETRERLKEEEEKAFEKYNKQFGLTELAAEVVFNQQVYSLLVTKHEELKAQHIMQRNTTEIIEEAAEPLYPSKPKRKIIFAASILAGGFLGLTLAFFKIFTDKTIHDPKSLAESLNLPVLGVIPRLRNHHEIKETIINKIPPGKLNDLYKNSYDMLYLETTAKIEILKNKSKGLTLLVTSSLDGEGKTSVSANLALCFALSDLKVLLIDSDNKTPDVDRIMELDQKQGLFDILEGNSDWDDAITLTETDGLSVMTSGRSEYNTNSSYFSSSHFDRILEDITNNFDIVIFDSQSLASSAIPAAIGSKVDATILVIKADTTNREYVNDTQGILENSGSNVIGTVLNFTRIKHKG